MKIKKNIILNFSPKTWEKFCSDLGEYSLFSSYELLKYYSQFKNIYDLSFAVTDDENNALALVPIAKYKQNLNFPDDPCPSISIKKEIKESDKRKIYKFCLTEIKKIMDKNKLKNYFFYRHPFQNKISNNLTLENAFDMLKYSKIKKVRNTSIIDLTKDENIIYENMSKYHKRNLKRSSLSKKNFICSNDFNFNERVQFFFNFKKQHIIDRGKKTRSEGTWKEMLDCLKNDKAILYLVEYEKKYVSYLFVGVNKFFAFGWSQVNDKSIEKDIMPRHFLEWQVIKDLKKRNILYYDLGLIIDWHDKDLNDKLSSISNFKEKFGGSLYPKIYYELNIKDFEKYLKQYA